MAGRSTYEDREYYPSGPPVRTREREPDRGYRPNFLRDDYGRQDQSGAVVLREREETVVRPLRSPSPVRVRDRYIERSPTPPIDFRSTRVIEREHERRRSPSPTLRARVVETRERVRERTPSPVRIRERYVERQRSVSPDIDRVRIRNIEQREVVKRPSPSPPAPPPILAPTIHQEVITHHRHIDHGYEAARVPTPPPPPRRVKETDIDIYTSRHNTEVDITRRESETRPRRPQYIHDDSYIYEQEKDRLRVSDTRLDVSRRRSLSARPQRRESSRVRVDIRDNESEAEYYRRKTNERAVIGEAYNGATKDWTIIDVPPGTERVRMDGVGGGSQEISWQKYNGVRRSRFIPERERETTTETVRDRVEIRDDAPVRETSTLEIDISSRRRHGGSYEYERIEESSDRRAGLTLRPKKVDQSLWTEITKDLVDRKAIEELGYDFEETEYFFYILEYLRYEEVLELVQLSDTIRRERQHRIREIEWERERMTRPDYRRPRGVRYDDERITEREVIYADRTTRRNGGW